MAKKVEKVTVKCLYCGKEYKVLPSDVKYRHHIYCSRKCSTQHEIKKRVTVKCLYCGKEHKVPPSVAKIRHHFFCNKKCFRKSGFNKCKGRGKSDIAPKDYKTVLKKTFEEAYQIVLQIVRDKKEIKLNKKLKVTPN